MENKQGFGKNLFSKEPATVANQIKKLKQRGMIIKDEDYAAETLTCINYYRLVHYFSVFLDSEAANKRYRTGTSFEDGMCLYDFDRRLRNALLIILEEIEVSMRALISNFHALKYGALGYLNASSFDREHKHQVFLNKIEYSIESNKNEDFVKHYKNKHKGAFPLWVIMELFSFGALAYFYSDMKSSDKKELVKLYFHEKVSSSHLASWLECLSALRNHCAHYNRIYANNLSITPKALYGENGETIIGESGSLYELALIMKLLHKRKTDIYLPLKNLFNEYRGIIDVSVMGFPEGFGDNSDGILFFSDNHM